MRSRVWIWVIYGCWIVAAVAILLAISLERSHAHEWYPHECCSDRDCWPTGVGEREPDPVEVIGGWRLHDGAFVSYKEAMPSPDGRFHVCRSGGAKTGAIVRMRDNRPCLWVPQGGT